MTTSFDLEPVHLEAAGSLGVQERSRLETMISLAKQNPRSIEAFRSRVLSLATLNESVAEQCLYALPRTSKSGEAIKIEGPSIRMAEIVLKSWRNAGVFGRIVESNPEYVVAQAVFIDFEDLTMVSKEVRRRVLGKHGDARTLAENAAIAVVSRNAIFGAIPRAIWQEAYERAKAVAAGTLETLEARRTEAVEWLKAKKVSEERVFAALDVEGINDIGLDELALLRTLVVQVRAGEMTVDQAFPDPSKVEERASGRGVAALKERLGASGEGRDAESDQAVRPA